MTTYENYPKVPLVGLITDLLFDIPDLDEDAAVHYLRRAAIMMAQKGNLLRRTVEICPQACVENYLLESPDCMEIVAVDSVCQVRGGLCGKVVRLTNEPCRLPCGTYCWIREPNEICFSEARCDQIYRVELVVAPPVDACEIDRVYQTKYWETLLTGARALVYDLNDKPWSNANRAAHYRAQFDLEIKDWAIDVLMGGQRGAMKIKRPFVV